MNIISKIMVVDLIVCLVIVLLCAVAYFIAGLMLVIKKDSRLISKKLSMQADEKFAFTYGLIEIIASVPMAVLAILCFFFQDQYLIFLGIPVLLVIILFTVQIILQKKYKI